MLTGTLYKETIKEMQDELSAEELPIVNHGLDIAKKIPYEVKNIQFGHTLDAAGNLKSCGLRILMEPSSGCPCYSILVGYLANRNYCYVNFLATDDYSYDRKLLKIAKAINNDKIEITDLSIKDATKVVLDAINEYAAEAKKIMMKRNAPASRRTRKTNW